MTVRRKITGLEIVNYRGIAALKVPVSELGLLARGGNKRGKSTILRAIGAALHAQDIGADAIRIGTDRAEILLNMDDISVRRVIGPKKSTLSISKGPAHTAANVIASKQADLMNMLGTVALDPLKIFLAPRKERRAKILEVLPITTTLDELRRFAPDLPDDFDTNGHGLEVLERAKKRYYDARTDANRAVATAKAAKDEAFKLAAVAPPDEPINVAGALLSVEEAKAAEAALVTRAREAAAAKERTAATQLKINALRERVVVLSNSTPGPDAATLEGAHTEFSAAHRHVRELEIALVAARAAFETKRADLASLIDAERAWGAVVELSTSLREQADALASAIESVAVAPDQADFAAARTHINDADIALTHARQIEAGRLLRAKALDAKHAHKAAEDRAAALDVTVKALTNDAPAELLSTANSIPGLTLDGDDVLLEGKRLDGLCGEEQLELAVEIARRANAKSGILVVDKLEALDPTYLERFLRAATAGGYQLIATRVSEGDLKIEAIELEDEDGDGGERAAEAAAE
jgi:hypothetical protein